MSAISSYGKKKNAIFMYFRRFISKKGCSQFVKNSSSQTKGNVKGFVRRNKDILIFISSLTVFVVLHLAISKARLKLIYLKFA